MVVRQSVAQAGFITFTKTTNETNNANIIGFIFMLRIFTEKYLSLSPLYGKNNHNFCVQVKQFIVEKNEENQEKATNRKS